MLVVNMYYLVLLFDLKIQHNNKNLFYNDLKDGDCILILRENGKLSIVKKNEMTISLTQATKESTAQERINNHAENYP